MVKILDLIKFIKDEIDGSNGYIKKALANKYADARYATKLAAMSDIEMKHAYDFMDMVTSCLQEKDPTIDAEKIAEVKAYLKMFNTMINDVKLQQMTYKSDIV